MVASVAGRLGRPFYGVEDLAEELRTIFGVQGLSTLDLNTGNIDGRYARLAAANAFTASQTISGAVTVSGAPADQPAVQISHAGVAAAACQITATGAGGALAASRNVGTAGRSLVVLQEKQATAVNLLQCEYAGSANAIAINHTGAGGYGVSTNRGINVSGASLFTGPVSCSAGVIGNLTGRATIATVADFATVAGTTRSALASAVLNVNTTTISYLDPTFTPKSATVVTSVTLTPTTIAVFGP